VPGWQGETAEEHTRRLLRALDETGILDSNLAQRQALIPSVDDYRERTAAAAAAVQPLLPTPTATPTPAAARRTP
jgi:hypothetical protein